MTQKYKLYGWVYLFTMLVKLGNYQLYPKYIFKQAFYRLILLIQKNEKINILSVQFIILNFPPSSGAKKGSDEWHFDHFTNIFWVKRTFNKAKSRTALSNTVIGVLKLNKLFFEENFKTPTLFISC